MIQEIGEVDFLAGLVQNFMLRQVIRQKIRPQKVVLVIWKGQQNQIAHGLSVQIGTGAGLKWIELYLHPSCRSFNDYVFLCESGHTRSMRASSPIRFGNAVVSGPISRIYLEKVREKIRRTFSFSRWTECQLTHER